MRTYIRFAVSVLALVAMIHLTGCASMAAYKVNKRSAYIMKARAQHNDAAIKAIRSGDMVGIGIEVGALGVIFHSPKAALLQLGGAVVDGAVLYGIGEAIDSLNSDSSNSRNGSTINNYGDNNSYNVVNGDGNSGNNSGNETSTGGTSNFDPETTTTDGSQ